MIKIVITVEGGVVQDVSSNHPDKIDVTLIDQDSHEVSEYGVSHMTDGAIERMIADTESEYEE